MPRVEINPKDALELGIEQGDWVWIETERGKVRQVADLYHGIRPGTINCEHQWWLPEFHGATKGFDLISINCLVNKDMRDPLCGSSYARALQREGVQSHARELAVRQSRAVRRRRDRDDHVAR